MSHLRLLLITRRFWPLVGGAEIVMANLASEFSGMGNPSRILTASWEPHWPMEVLHRDIPVTRIPQSRRRLVGTGQYMIGVNRWLRDHRDQYDAVLVSMLKHDAYAALRTAGRMDIPVVLRAEGGGPSGDALWQDTARFGRRIRQRCQQAAAVIAPTESIRQELLDRGYQSSRLHCVANGVPVPTLKSEKLAARKALFEVNADLAANESTRVAVYTGRLAEGKGLADLVRAWKHIAARQPQARLWVVGDGPLREPLFQLIKDLELVGRVLLPGSFDDVSDILRAADVFVLPSYAEGLSLSLLEAMAYEVPAVVSDIPGNTTVVSPGETGVLFPVGDVAALTEQLESALLLPEESAVMATQARNMVQQRYSIQSMAQAHLEVIQDVVQQTTGAKS